MATSKPERAAIVTGAGSGIGREVAVMLAERGWRVALVGRRDAPLRETAGLAVAAGAEALVVPGDVGDPAARARIVRQCIDQLGRLDAVINNAGYAPLVALDQMPDDMIHAIFRVNVEGPIAIVREAAGALSGGGGRVVNVSSVSSQDPFPGLGVYGAAKAALNVATLAMTREIPGLRAFAVAPGAVETRMLRSIVSERDLPTERCLTPGEVARVIVACAVGERDEHSGKTIFLDGPGRPERVAG